MRIGFQGEGLSYSDQASSDLFPDADRRGYRTFVAAFEALRDGEVDRLVLPIENSTTGSILPVLDRLVPGKVHIAAEHHVEVRHCLLGAKGATLETIRRVHSQPEALAQAETMISHRGWIPVPEHDTAGAVRLVAERGDPAEAALAPERAAAAHNLQVLLRHVVDRDHNTTRFVVLVPGDPIIDSEADKSTVMFTTLHRPGALALALTELGLRGANLTRIESRPSDAAWQYRFFVDLTHPPGEQGLKAVFEPPLSTIGDIRFLGTYRSVSIAE